MKSPEEYRESLRGMRPNIYKFGELIEDVTTHPATRRSVEGHAKIYEISQTDEYRELFTKHSELIGERVSRYLTVIESQEDAIADVRMKRTMFNLTGTCTGGRCVGWNCLNAMWSTTYDMDQENGTEYHARLREWLKDAQKRDIAVAGALTDPKGNRRLPPSKQKDPDLHLRVVERREDGMVVRGAKVMICGVAAAHEIFILPGSRYGEEDRDYAVSFVIPRDAEGLTVVEARHPSDRRAFEDGWDNPVRYGGITQAYLLFEDVFVPWERVFMCGEYRYTGEAVSNFIAPYRSAIGGCVAGQGDVMIGASLLLAEANGLSEKEFRERIIQMVINNETTFGMGVAAAALGKKHPSGAYLFDMLLANVNKVHVGTLPYDTKRIAQDIGGGIAETGCIPSYTDIMDERYGALLRKYLTAEADHAQRVKAARLIEWLTLGSGVPGCMHGGGSPQGAKLFIKAFASYDAKRKMAQELLRDNSGAQ